MRAVILLVNIAALGLAWYFASFVGLMIAVGVCVILTAGIFAFSMAKTDARESKDMKRAMGRNTTLLGRLL
ncbi:MAG TPA: hypothetical protein VGI11_11285 [Variovorax sp.]